jgi:hypothetical protein
VAAPDTATLLDQVRQAISDLVTAGVAESADGSQSWTMVDLGRLQALEDALTRRLAAEQGGNFRFARPMRAS